MSEQIKVKGKEIVIRDSLNKQVFDRACNTFLIKMIYDSSGKKGKIYLDRILLKKIKIAPGLKINFQSSDLNDLRSQDVQDWLIRLHDICARQNIDIPKINWEKI